MYHSANSHYGCELTVKKLMNFLSTLKQESVVAMIIHLSGKVLCQQTCSNGDEE